MVHTPNIYYQFRHNNIQLDVYYQYWIGIQVIQLELDSVLLAQHYFCNHGNFGYFQYLISYGPIGKMAILKWTAEILWSLTTS